MEMRVLVVNADRRRVGVRVWFRVEVCFEIFAVTISGLEEGGPFNFFCQGREARYYAGRSKR